MAHDEMLAASMRDALEGLPDTSEKRMMGGICFFVNGNMLCGADRTKAGEGRFMFRVGKDQEDEALARPGAAIMEMGGRRMNGFVFVDADDCDTETLKAWVSLALGFVGGLPPK